MGTITNVQFGIPTGKIGDLIYKYYKGKIIVYPYKPSNKPLTENTIQQNKKFSLFLYLCKEINKINIINSVWEDPEYQGNSVKAKQFKLNYGLMGPGEDISKIKLVPAVPEYSFEILSKSFSEGCINITLELSEAAAFISEKCYRDISAQGIMMLTDPQKPKKHPLAFIPLVSGCTNYKKNIPLQFQIPLMGESLELFNTYPVKNFIMNLLIKSNTSSIKYFSDTIASIW